LGRLLGVWGDVFPTAGLALRLFILPVQNWEAMGRIVFQEGGYSIFRFTRDPVLSKALTS
jgi:hypothetical protein